MGRKSTRALFLILLVSISCFPEFIVSGANGINLDSSLFSTSITYHEKFINTGIYFSFNTNSSSDGNWIELDGGHPIRIPRILIDQKSVENSTIGFSDRNVTVVSASSGDSLVYPFNDISLYVPGDVIKATFLGSPSFSGLDVDFCLSLVQPDKLGAAVIEAMEGNPLMLLTLLEAPASKVGQILDASGDASAEFFADAPGLYSIFVIVREREPHVRNIWILGGTVVEVVDYPSYISVQPKLVTGTTFSVDIYSKSPEYAEKFVYGGFVLREGAYDFEVKLNPILGLIPSSDMQVNGLFFSNDLLPLLSGRNNVSVSFDKDNLIGNLTKFYGVNLVASGFSEPVSSGHGVISMLVDSDLPEGEYILMTGVWQVGSGKQLTAVKQTSIDFLKPVSLEILPVDSAPQPPPDSTPSIDQGVSLVKVEPNWWFVGVDALLLVLLFVVIVRGKAT